MYNSKSQLLTIWITNEYLSKDDNTIYCIKFSFLVKMKNYSLKIKNIGNIKSSIVCKVVPSPPPF